MGICPVDARGLEDPDPSVLTGRWSLALDQAGSYWPMGNTDSLVLGCWVVETQGSETQPPTRTYPRMSLCADERCHADVPYIFNYVKCWEHPRNATL